MTYNLDPNGSNSKPQPQIDNFSRNDSGLGPNGQNIGIAQENIRQDVNGSTDKPFPQERNWVLNNDPDGHIIQSHEDNDLLHQALKEPFGQVKYARREGAPSIYKDVSRNTADDNAATRKAEATTIYEDVDESEETRR